MMKRLLICISAALLLFSCEENDIEEYAEIPRIGFENSSTLGYTRESYIFFSDEDYLQNVLQKKDSVRLEVMGRALPHQAICCFKAVESGGEDVLKVKFPSHILLDSGSYTSSFPFMVSRPETIGKEYRQEIALDTERPEHSFGPGKQEGARMRIVCQYRLKPVAWNNYFGTYSDAKYLFMLDFFDATYSSIGNTAENRRLVREAYAEYRTGHEAILDDNGNEILFP